ncbi:MAG TPA: NIPSNAP family protein [Candidatus Limnocylindrales bacterium]|nr:NIPSNAP family protein [Candidatus Limnocylindrales bacterium]
MALLTWQIREYTVKPGEMQQWVAEWRSAIVPLRQRHGFGVLGAWMVDGTDQFVWIISYGGTKTWQEAEADYYASPDRKALDPDPARHLAQTGARLMTSVYEP